jgi:hypothetical protein
VRHRYCDEAKAGRPRGGDIIFRDADCFSRGRAYSRLRRAVGRRSRGLPGRGAGMRKAPVARNIVIDECRTTRRRPEDVTVGLPDQPIADASEQLVNRHLVDAAIALQP